MTQETMSLSYGTESMTVGDWETLNTTYQKKITEAFEEPDPLLKRELVKGVFLQRILFTQDQPKLWLNS